MLSRISLFFGTLKFLPTEFQPGKNKINYNRMVLRGSYFSAIFEVLRSRWEFEIEQRFCWARHIVGVEVEVGVMGLGLESGLGFWLGLGLGLGLGLVRVGVRIWWGLGLG